MSTCRSCGAPLLWAVTERGKRMPLDLEPVNVDELDSVAGLFAVRALGVAFAATPDQLPGEPLRRSHFATCPQAGAWRRA